MIICIMDYRITLSVCLMVLAKHVSALSFVVTPSTGGVVGHLNNVKLRCTETNLPEDDRIHHFTISKLNGGIWSRLVYFDDRETIWTDTALQNRARITGDLELNRYIELEFTTLQCLDRGQYRCESSNIDEIKESQSAELYVNAVPSSVYMTSNPMEDASGLLHVDPNERVVLTCQGQVGSPPGSMVWYMRHSSAENFLPYNTNVTDGILIPDDSNCQNQMSSDLILYPPTTWPQFIFICNVSNSVNSEPISSTLTVAVRGVTFSGAETIKLSTSVRLAALFISGMSVHLTRF